jgi:hypothetical protein
MFQGNYKNLAQELQNLALKLQKFCLKIRLNKKNKMIRKN